MAYMPPPPPLRVHAILSRVPRVTDFNLETNAEGSVCGRADGFVEPSDLEILTDEQGQPLKLGQGGSGEVRVLSKIKIAGFAGKSCFTNAFYLSQCFEQVNMFVQIRPSGTEPYGPRSPVAAAFSIAICKVVGKIGYGKYDLRSSQHLGNGQTRIATWWSLRHCVFSTCCQLPQLVSAFRILAQVCISCEGCTCSS